LFILYEIKKKKWILENASVLRGLSLPCLGLLALPYIGPLLYFVIAQTGAAFFCLEFLANEDGGSPALVRSLIKMRSSLVVGNINIMEVAENAALNSDFLLYSKKAE
jgi:hypothetical protein